jgi:hypothetical protein
VHALRGEAANAGREGVMDTSRERSEVRILSIGHLARVRHWLTEHLSLGDGGDRAFVSDTTSDGALDRAPERDRDEHMHASVQVSSAQASSATSVSPSTDLLAPDLLVGSGREKPDALHS